MSEGTHDTHDYEHVWPPYGVELAQPETRTFPDRMMVWCGTLEQRIEVLEAKNEYLSAFATWLQRIVRDADGIPWAWRDVPAHENPYPMSDDCAEAEDAA